MTLDPLVPISEAGASAADFASPVSSVKANSPILSADVNQLVEIALRRTRFLKNRDTDPNTWAGLNSFTGGIVVTQSTLNGDAASITGNGTGRGISCVGGASSGLGLRAQGGAPNGVALEAQGSGSGEGATITGGASAAGASISAGGGNNPGVRAYGTGTGAAIACEVGGVEFNGTQPTATADPGANVVHATHIDKAWALVTTDGLGNATLVDGVNIASVAIVGGAALHVTLAGAMASTNYGVSTTDQLVPAAGVARTFHTDGATNTTTLAKIGGRTITVGSIVVVDFGAEALRVLVRITGRQ